MLYHQSHKTWGREVKEDAPTNTAVKSKQIRGFHVFLHADRETPSEFGDKMLASKQCFFA